MQPRAKVESVDVTIESVHVGKNPENLIACTPTLVAARTCSTFGEFVKFSLKIEHPADCICLHEGQAQGLTAGNQTAVKDAFSMMMSAARVAARDRKTLPDPGYYPQCTDCAGEGKQKIPMRRR